MLNKAVRDGKLAVNPISRIKLYKESAGRTRFLSMEEGLLLEALGQYGAWARLAVLTGLRQGEQFHLKWADVDLERGVLTLPSTKNGAVQYVRLNGEAREMPWTMRENRSIWVFPCANLNTPMDARNFYRRVFLPALKKVGLEGISWHSLRHTFESRLAMNGAGDSTIAALLRHSGTSLVKRYAHLSPSHLQDAVEQVAGFGKLKTAPPESSSHGTVTGTGCGEANEAQRSHKSAEILVAVPRIERGTRGL